MKTTKIMTDDQINFFLASSGLTKKKHQKLTDLKFWWSSNYQLLNQILLPCTLVYSRCLSYSTRCPRYKVCPGDRLCLTPTPER